MMTVEGCKSFYFLFLHGILLLIVSEWGFTLTGSILVVLLFPPWSGFVQQAVSPSLHCFTLDSLKLVGELHVKVMKPNLKWRIYHAIYGYKQKNY